MQMFTNLLQILAVIHHVTIWLILPIVSVWLPVYILCWTQFWWLMCAYFAWYCYDFNTPSRGSRYWKWYKNSWIWKYFADYFPIRLVKTTDLSSEQNYILGCHPHGILSIGAFTHLCTNGTGFAEKFPGIQSNLATLNGQFWFPFRREFGIALGGIQSCKKSLTYLLENPGKGRMIGLVIGGAEEALDAKPDQHIVNLLPRRGFCKLALQYGAHLVPSYSFGENDVYHQDYNDRGSSLRKIQSLIKKKAGFCPPLFMGRGLLIERLGIFPIRSPITTVIGEPIVVPRFENPTKLQIEALHARYCVALVELFESHKREYGVPKNVHLKFF